jgi:hypothetical protein
MSTTINTRACRRNSYIPGCSYLFVDLDRVAARNLLDGREIVPGEPLWSCRRSKPYSSGAMGSSGQAFLYSMLGEIHSSH